MRYFQWNEDLMTGVALLDEQHRTLLAMGENLRQAFLHGVESDQAVQLLESLSHYSDFHFATEEAWLEANAAPYLHKQHRLHQDILQKMGDKILAIRKHQLPATAGIAVYIVEGIRRHILEEDREAIHWSRREFRVLAE